MEQSQHSSRTIAFMIINTSINRIYDIRVDILNYNSIDFSLLTLWVSVCINLGLICINVWLNIEMNVGRLR